MSQPDRSKIFREETDDPHYADERNFYKLEKWTKDGAKVDRLLYAGAEAVKHRPRILPTIRQRTRVMALNWPEVP